MPDYGCPKCCTKNCPRFHAWRQTPEMRDVYQDRPQAWLDAVCAERAAALASRDPFDFFHTTKDLLASEDFVVAKADRNNVLRLPMIELAPVPTHHAQYHLDRLYRFLRTRVGAEPTEWSVTALLKPEEHFATISITGVDDFVTLRKGKG